MVNTQRTHEQHQSDELATEMKLHINQRLFERGIISQEVYELAKVKIVSPK